MIFSFLLCCEPHVTDTVGNFVIDFCVIASLFSQDHRTTLTRVLRYFWGCSLKCPLRTPVLAGAGGILLWFPCFVSISLLVPVLLHCLKQIRWDISTAIRACASGKTTAVSVPQLCDCCHREWWLPLALERAEVPAVHLCRWCNKEASCWVLLPWIRHPLFP